MRINRMDTRAFIFAAWIASGKSKDSTITLLETIASGQVEVYQRGGKTLISTTIGSESFSYQLSGMLSTDTVTGMAYDGWRAVQKLADDAALTQWLKADDVMCMRAGFYAMRDF